MEIDLKTLLSPSKKNRGRKPTLSSPEVKVMVDNLGSRVDDIKTKQSITSIRTLIANPEIKGLLEEIIDMSAMSEPQKNFVRAVFVEGLSQKKAVKAAFGNDLGYGAEITDRAMLQTSQIKEFADIIKGIYIKVAPVAVMKEVEVMLTGDHDQALAAARDLQDRAGAGANAANQNNLPVQVIINMPGSQSIQGEVINGEQQ